MLFLGPIASARAQSKGDTAPKFLTTLRVALQWKPQSQFAGFYMADAKDLYRAAGLDVRLYHADALRNSLDMLRDGEAELATSFLADALIASAKSPSSPRGAPGRVQPSLVQVAQMVRRSNLMLVAWKELGIDGAADLDGRRVSYWQGSFSSSYEAFFRAKGIRPEQIPQYYSVNLFLRRGVAACAAMEYNEYDRIRQAGIDEDRLTVFLMRDFGLGFPEDGIYASPEWIARNRDTALAFRKATIAGWEYARSHVEETIDIVLAEARKAGVPANRPHERWMLGHILSSIFIQGESADKVGVLDAAEFDKTVGALRSAGLLSGVPSFAAFAPMQEKAR
jgi:NitT/TauT family transport system substrate-binding protein